MYICRKKAVEEQLRLLEEEEAKEAEAKREAEKRQRQLEAKMVEEDLQITMGHQPKVTMADLLDEIKDQEEMVAMMAMAEGTVVDTIMTPIPEATTRKPLP